MPKANRKHITRTSAATIVERARSRPHLRLLIEEFVEAAILLLDELDGDTDLEDGAELEDSADDEPSIGVCCGYMGVDLELDTSDYEHTLGWSNPMGESPAQTGFTSNDHPEG